MVIKLYIATSMKVQAENYKGIEFVRISKLPENQKTAITQTIARDKIIKILMENELLVDCIQFTHYELWYDVEFKKALTEPQEQAQPEKAKSFKLALD